MFALVNITLLYCASTCFKAFCLHELAMLRLIYKSGLKADAHIARCFMNSNAGTYSVDICGVLKKIISCHKLSAMARGDGCPIRALLSVWIIDRTSTHWKSSADLDCIVYRLTWKDAVLFPMTLCFWRFWSTLEIYGMTAKSELKIRCMSQYGDINIIFMEVKILLEIGSCPQKYLAQNKTKQKCRSEVESLGTASTTINWNN